VRGRWGVLSEVEQKRKGVIGSTKQKGGVLGTKRVTPIPFRESFGEQNRETRSSKKLDAVPPWKREEGTDLFLRFKCFEGGV